LERIRHARDGAGGTSWGGAAIGSNATPLAIGGVTFISVAAGVAEVERVCDGNLSAGVGVAAIVIHGP